MKLRPSWNKTSVIFGAIALWGVLLIGCVGVNRAVLAPPHVPGATYVGDKECSTCHADKTDHFKSASHAKIALADPKLGTTSCEACHGAGSLHSAAGGGKGNIINPKKSPEACFQCHVDKRGQFSLPNAHPVLAGHVTCIDCHDVHEGDAIKGKGLALESMNETCTKCHIAQKGPFVFEHGAVKEGCVSCHSPHGSVNAKMLVARDANLCLRCHLTSPPVGQNAAVNSIAQGQIRTSSNATASAVTKAAGQAVNGVASHQSEHHNSDVMRGTCWSAGCHEAIHGSNANNHFRR